MLKEDGIEMYSTYNEGKSVVVEIFIRTLKRKIHKHMTAVPKNVELILNPMLIVLKNFKVQKHFC